MGSLTCLTDPAVLLVADTCAVINLNATGCAHEILRAVPNRLAVADVVPAELESGGQRGRQNAYELNHLVAAGLVEVVSLDETATQHFERLVIGPAAMTLDDGEAATIAYCVAHGGTAIIDERKANRICAERFSALRVGCTTDIFAHPDVLPAVGHTKLAEAVLNALQLARMRVLPHHVEWVVGLIGREQAALCMSLPRSARLSM
jgi:predicted nucleic acid-binding protein